MNNFKIEIEERLIGFAAMVLNAYEAFPESFQKSDLGTQILYGASGPAFAHAEAQSADSSKEFLASLKECRNSLHQMHISLRIARRVLDGKASHLDPVIEECSHLIALLAKSVKTKKTNMSKDGKAEVMA